MSKGDFIEIKHQIGVVLETTRINADRAGRKVEGKWVVEQKLPWFKAELQSRTGNVIESISLPAEAIVSIKVHVRDVP